MGSLHCVSRTFYLIRTARENTSASLACPVTSGRTRVSHAADPSKSCSDFSSNRLRVPVQLEPLLMWTGSRVNELPIPECKVNHPKDFDIRLPLGSSQPGFLA